MKPLGIFVIEEPDSAQRKSETCLQSHYCWSFVYPKWKEVTGPPNTCRVHERFSSNNNTISHNTICHIISPDSNVLCFTWPWSAPLPHVSRNCSKNFSFLRLAWRISLQKWAQTWLSLYIQTETFKIHVLHEFPTHLFTGDAKKHDCSSKIYSKTTFWIFH